MSGLWVLLATVLRCFRVMPPQHCHRSVLGSAAHVYKRQQRTVASGLPKVATPPREASRAFLTRGGPCRAASSRIRSGIPISRRGPASRNSKRFCTSGPPTTVRRPACLCRRHGATPPHRVKCAITTPSGPWKQALGSCPQPSLPRSSTGARRSRTFKGGCTTSTMATASRPASILRSERQGGAWRPSACLL